jgi:hypothetical protein
MVPPALFPIDSVHCDMHSVFGGSYHTQSRIHIVRGFTAAPDWGCHLRPVEYRQIEICNTDFSA